MIDKRWQVSLSSFVLVTILTTNLTSKAAEPASNEASKSIPKVSRVNMLATPPGQPVVISGSGFSKNASENLVMFGNVRARVVSATESNITCIVPNMQFPRWHVPIVVTSNGVPSKGRVTINIDQRVIPNQGVPMR